MSFGRDLQDFVQSFTAGYNMIGQSQKDKAAMEESKGRTALMAEQTREMPAKAAYEKAQTDMAEARAHWYDMGAPRTSIKGDPAATLEGSTAEALGGGSGAIPDPSQAGGDPQQYAPGGSAPPAASDDALPAGFDDTGTTDDTSAAMDQSNYAPSSGAIPDYRTAAPTNDGAQTQAAAPHPHIAPLFSAIDQRYNLPPGYALAVSGIETGHTYDPAIVNPKSKAAGLFQFMPATARAMGVDPTNPASAAHGFGQLTLANQQILTRALGRAPTPAELYLAHQQGPAAAEMMIRNPGVPAVAVLTRAYQQAGAKNPQALAQQALVGNGGSMDMTAGQFAGKWMGQFNRELARSGGQSGAPVQVASANPAPNPGAGVSDATPDALAMSDTPAAKPFDVNTDTPVGRAFAQRPVQSATESDAAYQARLAQYKAYNPSSEADYEKAHASGGAAPTDALSAVNAVGGNPQGNPLKAGIKAGLGAVSDRFAPQGSGAVPVDQGQPQVQKYLSGDTGAAPNVVQQLRKIVPGAAKMNDGEFGAAAISFIMQSDKLQPAQRVQAIGDLLQYYRNGFNQYAAIAKAAVQSGNLDDAVKASVKAYMHIPDGQSVTAVKQDDSGKYLITFKDDKTGDVTSKQLLSPSEMGAQIMKTTPVLFDQTLAQMVATPDKPTTITDAGREAAASLSDDNTDAAQAVGKARTAADVVAIKTAASLEEKQGAENKSLGDNATTFVTSLGAQFDRPNVVKNLGPDLINQYKSVLADHQTNLEAAAATALRSKSFTPAELMDAANNIIEIKGMNPDAPPSFQASTDGARTKVEWDGGDITIPTKTFKAFLSVRQDLLSQLASAKAKALQDNARPANMSGSPTDRDERGQVRRQSAIPAPGNPWTPSPGNVPGPAPTPGPWDAPPGAQSAVDPNDPNRLNLPSGF